MKRISTSRVLAIPLLGATILALLMGKPSTSVAAASAPPVYTGMWITKAELDALPMSGAGWTQLKSAADASWGKPDLADIDSKHDTNTLAGALVFARSGNQLYRVKVADALMSAIGTENSGTASSDINRSLAIARNLAAYVVAADLINFPAYDTLREARFRQWLSAMRSFRPGTSQRSLVWTHEVRPNNFGTMAGASRIAIDIYLGDKLDVARAWTIFRGWTGDRTAYAGFKFDSDLSWHCDPSRPTPLNPPCVKAGHYLGGGLPDDMQRGGPYNWCPGRTQYPWGALQGAIVQTELLHRQGYPSRSINSSAILRAYKFLSDLEQQCGGWWGVADNRWQPALVNYMSGSSYLEFTAAGAGKIMGWTEWTHGSRVDGSATPVVLPPPVSPSPSPSQTPVPAPVSPSPSPSQTPAPAPSTPPPGSSNGTPSPAPDGGSAPPVEPPADEPTDDPAVSSSRTLRFGAEADTFVRIAQPTVNFGSNTRLRAKEGSAIAFVRFRVSGLQEADGAVLRLFATRSNPGIVVRRAESDSWSEADVAHLTAPPVGGAIAASGAYSGGRWITLDVTDAVWGDGVYTFAITSSSRALAAFASREAPLNPRRAPVLIVRDGAGSD